MLTLLRAGLFALACLFLPAPAYAASPGCRPLELMLREIDDVAAAGVRVVMLRESEIAPVMAAITAAHGPTPRPLQPDLIILLIGDQSALVLFAEGVEVCLKLPMTRAGADGLERIAKGRPA